MNKLGIIGGAGPLASALLYETLVRECYALGHTVPEIVLINYPFTRGLSQEEGLSNAGTLKEQMNYCINFLAQNGVQRGVLACNTLHLILQNCPQDRVHFHYLPDIVVNAAKENKHQRLLILGTRNTCGSRLYQIEGVNPLYPTLHNQSLIDQVIDRVLEGKILEADARLFDKIIQQTALEENFDGIVLGCTEIPLLHHHFPIRAEKSIYDSIKIPAKTLVGNL